MEGEEEVSQTPLVVVQGGVGEGQQVQPAAEDSRLSEGHPTLKGKAAEMS